MATEETFAEWARNAKFSTTRDTTTGVHTLHVVAVSSGGTDADIEQVTGDNVSGSPYSLDTFSLVALINASGNRDRWHGVAGDAQAITGLGAVGPMLWNGATFDRAREASGDSLAVTGVVAAAHLLWNGTTYQRAYSVINVADGSDGNKTQAVAPQLFNGTSFDRHRGNVNTAAIATVTAAVAGTTSGADQTNHNGRGAQFFVDISAISAATTATVNIQVKDPVSGNYLTILSSAALASVATTMLTVYPGSPVTANVSVSTPLPRTYRAQVVVAGAGTVTATVSASVQV